MIMRNMLAASSISVMAFASSAQATDWVIPESGNMAHDPREGPERPENSMTTVASRAGNRITVAQLIRTALVGRFVFSGSNCSNQLPRVAFEVEVPNLSNTRQQAEMIREAAEPGVRLVQELCGFGNIKADVFETNFLETLEELATRDARYDEALKAWHTRRSQPGSRRNPQN